MALLLLTPFQEARSAAPAALLCRNYLLKDRGQVEVVQYSCWRSLFLLLHRAHERRAGFPSLPSTKRNSLPIRETRVRRRVGETPSRTCTFSILYIYCSNVSDSESAPVGDGLTEREPKSANEFQSPFIQ